MCNRCDRYLAVTIGVVFTCVLFFATRGPAAQNAMSVLRFDQLRNQLAGPGATADSRKIGAANAGDSQSAVDDLDVADLSCDQPHTSCTQCGGLPQNAMAYCGPHAKGDDCRSSSHWSCEFCERACGAHFEAYIRLAPKAGILMPARRRGFPDNMGLEAGGVQSLMRSFGPDEFFGRLVGPTLIPLFQSYDENATAYTLTWDPSAVPRGGDVYTLQLVHLRTDYDTYDRGACAGPSDPFVR